MDGVRCGTEAANKSQSARGVLPDGVVLASGRLSDCRFLALESICDMAEFLIEFAHTWQSRFSQNSGLFLLENHVRWSVDAPRRARVPRLLRLLPSREERVGERRAVLLLFLV